VIPVNCTICLVTGSHLCHNPRVLKSAKSLAHHGFSVEVLGAWSDPILKARDEALLGSLPFKFTPVIDVTSGKLSQLRRRLRRRVGRIFRQLSNTDNRLQLGYFYPELRRAAFRRTADLYIAHSEQAMAVAVDLLGVGHRVGVDMEDWFSEDLLPQARRHRPINLLRHLEKELLVRGGYAACPSTSLSAALVDAYGGKSPGVIYNAFAWADRLSLDRVQKDRHDSKVPSIHWYSQTIGPGRGIEDLLGALPLLKHDVEIHLRGQPTADLENWLERRIPHTWRDRIFLHGLVTNIELLSRIAEHDIGFAGELTYCRSRDLTVTNKILHYLLGGLAVVASNTTGQREVAKQSEGAVFLYPPGDSYSLAATINMLLASTEKLNHAKACALEAAQQTFCWERQEKILLTTIVDALGQPVRSNRTK
jgi:glycosyltransferase involved in cell wall biosynthesis